MGSQESFMQNVIQNYTAMAAKGSKSFDAGWQDAVRATDQMLSLLGAQTPGRILDLACGAGGATIAMAMKGFDVTGIDCTPAMLETARQKAKEKGVSVRWVCQDMRTIEYDNEFDYVCLRDVVFGIFEGDGQDADLLRRIGRALKARGKTILEVYNKEFSLRHGVEGALFYDQGRDRFVQKGKSISIRLYSQSDLEQMLLVAGLTVVERTGWNYPSDPAPPPWRADMIVAVKSA